MYSRQLEQIASQRPTELRASRAASRPAPAGPARPAGAGHRRKPLRTQTGWALVWIGLRLAASGSR